MAKLHDDLGVSPDASDEDIKKAYRRRAKRAHPDHGGDPEAFHKIQNAYLVLRDPARRAHYERTGEERAPGADAVREGALQILGQAVGQALVSEDAAHVNLLKTIRDNLAGMNKQIAANSKEIAKRKAAIERNAKRWKKKAGDTPDIIASITSAALADCARASAEADHRTAIHAAAIEILDGYEYEHTPESQAQSAARMWQQINPAFNAKGW